MRIGGAQGAPPPSQTGQADLLHTAFRSAAADGLAQVGVPRCSEGTYQPRSPSGPAHPVTGGPLPAGETRPSGFPPHRHAQPYGTMSALMRWPHSGSRHCLPTSLRSTIITRFFATTDALTPAGPLVITHRGSLIHVTRTSHHSVSNHPRFSTRRVPLPQRWPHYFVRASPFPTQARQNRRPNRVHLAPQRGPCYGLIVHFQLLPTRGYGPGAVTFSYWPYSVGQVRDLHPAVQVRFQAHERGHSCPPRRLGQPPSGQECRRSFVCGIAARHRLFPPERRTDTFVRRCVWSLRLSQPQAGLFFRLPDGDAGRAGDSCRRA